MKKTIRKLLETGEWTVSKSVKIKRRCKRIREAGIQPRSFSLDEEEFRKLRAEKQRRGDYQINHRS